MLDRQMVWQSAESLLGSGLFVVEVKCSPAGEVEVVIDGDAPVSIDQCADLNRALSAELDRTGEEDYALTVYSAGVGRPLKLYRQYRKVVGRPVEVILVSGVKLHARLVDATETSITLSYPERILEPGKKHKTTVETVREFPLAEVKSTREEIDFK